MYASMGYKYNVDYADCNCFPSANTTFSLTAAPHYSLNQEVY